MIIKQNHYGLIDIDNTEKDIVQIWMTEVNPRNLRTESNVIQLERNNISTLIGLLSKCITNDPKN